MLVLCWASSLPGMGTWVMARGYTRDFDHEAVTAETRDVQADRQAGDSGSWLHAAETGPG